MSFWISAALASSSLSFASAAALSALAVAAAWAALSCLALALAAASSALALASSTLAAASAFSFSSSASVCLLAAPFLPASSSISFWISAALASSSLSVASAAAMAVSTSQWSPVKPSAQSQAQPLVPTVLPSGLPPFSQGFLPPGPNRHGGANVLHAHGHFLSVSSSVGIARSPSSFTVSRWQNPFCAASVHVDMSYLAPYDAAISQSRSSLQVGSPFCLQLHGQACWMRPASAARSTFAAVESGMVLA